MLTHNRHTLCRRCISAFAILLSLVAPGFCRAQVVAREKCVLQAEAWRGRLSLEFPARREWVVLFFEWPIPKSDDRVEKAKLLKAYVEKLNELARKRSDVLIVGLTTAKDVELQPFYKALKPAFPIGLQSTGYRRFDVKSFPELRTFTFNASENAADVKVILTAAALDDVLPPAMEQPSGPTATPEDLDSRETADLKDLVETLTGDVTQAGMVQVPQFEEALKLLRIRMDSVEFMDLCDDLKEQTPGYGIYLRRIAYERHMADPAILEKQSDDSPGGPILHEWRLTREDPKWSKVSAFFEALDKIEPLTTEAIVDQYKTVMTDEPCDVVIRSWYSDHLVSKGRFVLQGLFRLYDLEADPRIRGKIANDISKLAQQPGDPEVISFFEEKLQTEENIFWVRPILESQLYWLHGGK